jgi:hypothetical protein
MDIFPSSTSLKIRFYTLVPSRPGSSVGSLSFSLFNQNFVLIFHLPSARYMPPPPSHPPDLNILMLQVCLPIKTQPNNNHCDTKMKSEAGPPLCDRLSQLPPRDTRVKVTLVARPLLTLIAHKLCRWEHDVFTSRRACAQSGTLLRIELFCCSSYSK